MLKKRCQFLKLNQIIEPKTRFAAFLNEKMKEK